MWLLILWSFLWACKSICKKRDFNTFNRWWINERWRIVAVQNSPRFNYNLAKQRVLTLWTQRIENHLPYFWCWLKCVMCVYPQNVAHTRIWHGWIDVTAKPDALANKVGMHFFLSLNFRFILHFTLMLLTEHVINFKIGTLCIFHVYLKRFFLSLLFPLCMRNRFWWHTFMDAKKVITINTITKNRKNYTWNFSKCKK